MSGIKIDIASIEQAGSGCLIDNNSTLVKLHCPHRFASAGWIFCSPINALNTLPEELIERIFPRRRDRSASKRLPPIYTICLHSKPTSSMRWCFCFTTPSCPPLPLSLPFSSSVFCSFTHFHLRLHLFC
ncbi:hypothetical protein T12_6526 [Trichinella patagoniensis]|uniref:Uncharacterized protein n=1 Tax=Trichinella patagoniensis TaxID=990121 RepID=A0A0V0ZD64_9BILA|nr:hypothetical protein T12_6526 [Trichinella patagoniensis]